jgi:hypothetical protein
MIHSLLKKQWTNNKQRTMTCWSCKEKYSLMKYVVLHVTVCSGWSSLLSWFDEIRCNARYSMFGLIFVVILVWWNTLYCTFQYVRVDLHCYLAFREYRQVQSTLIFKTLLPTHTMRRQAKYNFIRIRNDDSFIV